MSGVDMLISKIKFFHLYAILCLILWLKNKTLILFSQMNIKYLQQHWNWASPKLRKYMKILSFLLENYCLCKGCFSAWWEDDVLYLICLCLNWTDGHYQACQVHYLPASLKLHSWKQSNVRQAVRWGLNEDCSLCSSSMPQPLNLYHIAHTTE